MATVGIDEFSALGADHLIALLARGRESGISALVATQELADLDRAAFGLRDQVVGVTALKIIHRQEVPSSARTIAQMVGTEWVWEETRQTAVRLFGGYDTGRGTRRQVERFLVHPNEIQSLGTGRAVVISKLGDGGPYRVRVEPPRPMPSAEPARTVEPARRPDPRPTPHRHPTPNPAGSPNRHGTPNRGARPSAHRGPDPRARRHGPRRGRTARPNARPRPASPGRRRTPRRCCAGG